MPLETLLIYVLVVVGAVLAASVIIYSLRRRKRGKEEFSEIEDLEMSNPGTPFKVAKTVPSSKVGRVQKELRLLGLEREILSDAIRRLYEAHAEGRITEEEREKIAMTYKSRIRSVKEEISQDESLIALHELESMQEDLLKMFSDRFDKLTGKIERLRSRLDVEPVNVKPVKEIPVPTAQKKPPKKKPRRKKTRKKPPKKPPKKPTKKTPKKKTTKKPAKKKPKKKKKTPKKKKEKKEEEEKESPPKTEAEKKVEQIREEVEKVLDRLGQMEVET